MVTIYFLTLFVIFRTESSTTRLNEVKNLNTFTLCKQILRDAQDDNWGVNRYIVSFIFYKIGLPNRCISSGSSYDN